MDTKLEGTELRDAKNNGFKKKNRYKKHTQTINHTVDNVFRVGKEGLKLNGKQ